MNFENYERANAYNNSALNAMKEKKYVDAVQLLVRALIIDSVNLMAYKNITYAGMQISKFDFLIPYIERAKRIFNDNDEIYYYAGIIYLKLNDIERAIVNLDSAVRYSKINGEDYELVYAYYLNRGICYVLLAEYNKALSDFTYALKLNDKSSAIYTNRGIAYYKLQQYTEACSDWQKSRNMGDTIVLKYLENYCSTSP